ncbi:hypothetical protein R3W88_007380 [Solanum pinnatisectum]|uniref:Uncharacterized protein n=1 Tax=Solanum pinnatisectum TaxID=50273 RepID=A0AAV9M5I6_9SOLN|nr:hypothetical protein R3W88_007380 [Solanum pinnatisectum]
MLKQIGYRVSSVLPVNLWRWRQLYHYSDHRNVDKGGIPCMSLVAYQPNLKMIVDEKTGEIEDRKPFFHLPPVRLQYGRMLADDAIMAVLKDHEAKKTNLSDHSKNAVDA